MSNLQLLALAWLIAAVFVWLRECRWIDGAVTLGNLFWLPGFIVIWPAVLLDDLLAPIWGIELFKL